MVFRSIVIEAIQLIYSYPDKYLLGQRKFRLLVLIDLQYFQVIYGIYMYIYFTFYRILV